MIAEISVKSSRRNELIDVTAEVQKIAAKSKAKEGICVVYCPHTTAAITINENADPSVKEDIISALERLAPPNGNYAHSEGNSDAHIKAAVIGNSRTIIVKGGKPLLGRWEGIFFCEFDGPRSRKLAVLIK